MQGPAKGLHLARMSYENAEMRKEAKGPDVGLGCTEGRCFCTRRTSVGEGWIPRGNGMTWKFKWVEMGSG